MLILALASIQLGLAVRQGCCTVDDCRCSMSAEPGCCEDGRFTDPWSSTRTPARPLPLTERCGCCSADLLAWISGGISSPEQRFAALSGVTVGGDAAQCLKGAAVIHLRGSALERPISPSFCVAFCRWQC